MMMEYFQDPQGAVHGFDVADPAQVALMETIGASAWVNVTASWPPAAPAPTPAQQATSLLSDGLAITSPTIPLSAATFPADAASITKYIAVQLAILAGAAPPPIKDAAGVWHTVTAAQYTAIVSAISAFVTGCDLVADGHPGAVLPAATATIL